MDRAALEEWSGDELAEVIDQVHALEVATRATMLELVRVRQVGGVARRRRHLGDLAAGLPAQAVAPDRLRVGAPGRRAG